MARLSNILLIFTTTICAVVSASPAIPIDGLASHSAATMAMADKTSLYEIQNSPSASNENDGAAMMPSEQFRLPSMKLPLRLPFLFANGTIDKSYVDNYHTELTGLLDRYLVESPDHKAHLDTLQTKADVALKTFVSHALNPSTWKRTASDAANGMETESSRQDQNRDLLALTAYATAKAQLIYLTTLSNALNPTSTPHLKTNQGEGANGTLTSDETIGGILSGVTHGINFVTEMIPLLILNLLHGSDLALGNVGLDGLGSLGGLGGLLKTVQLANVTTTHSA